MPLSKYLELDHADRNIRPTRTRRKRGPSPIRKILDIDVKEVSLTAKVCIPTAQLQVLAACS